MLFRSLLQCYITNTKDGKNNRQMFNSQQIRRSDQKKGDLNTLVKQDL
jgi:hypothetical protein